MRMKLSKIMLDNNNQTTEALKHIYALMLANKKICITIDLPELEDSSDGEISSEDHVPEEGENDDSAEPGSQRSLQPVHTLAALNGSTEKASQNDMARLEGSASLDPAEEVVEDDAEELNDENW